MLTIKRSFILLAALLLLATHAHAQTVRYYISEVVAPDLVKDFYRLAIDDAVPAPSTASIIPSLPNGTPAFAWAICFARTNDWSGVDADPRNVRLFAGAEGDQADLGALLGTLSTERWGDITGAHRSAIRERLQTLGITTNDLSSAVSLRFVLQRVGRFLNPQFDETELYVTE